MAAMVAAVVPVASFSSPYLCFSSTRRATIFCSGDVSGSRRRTLRRGTSSQEKIKEIQAVSQKRFSGRGKDDRGPDGEATGRSKSSAFNSTGTQKKDKGLVYDLKEQQVQVSDTGNFQDSKFLNAVVKVYCTHTEPDYSLPWQKQRQYTSTGSAFMIGEGKLLTNAHCVEYGTQVFRSEEAENIGYVIPTTVVSHFLNDYERNGKYTGFPCLGVLLQKLENPALRACLKVPSNEGVLVRRIEPTSAASSILKEGDVIVSFDDVHVGSEGTVPFRSTERIAFRYLISQKFAGDVAEVGIIRDGTYMKVRTILHPRVHLVPYHIEGGQPSYLIIAGLVFTPLSEPLIEEECEDSIGLKLLAKARYSLARFKGEEIVILSQVLANEVNIGYEDMGSQQVLKLNGIRIKNIRHLAHLVDSCKDKYLVFEFEDNFLAVLDREAAASASACILKDYGIPSERSLDLLESYIDTSDDNQALFEDIGDSPVSNLEIGFDGLLWA